MGRRQQSDNCRQDKIVQEVGWLDEGRQDQDGLPQHHQKLLEAGPRQEPNWRKAGRILAKGAQGKMAGYLQGLVGNCRKAAPPGGVTDNDCKNHPTKIPTVAGRVLQTELTN